MFSRGGGLNSLDYKFRRNDVFFDKFEMFGQKIVFEDSVFS